VNTIFGLLFSIFNQNEANCKGIQFEAELPDKFT
jgi:hypothetical protein